MNTNNVGLAPSRSTAETYAKEGESFRAVFLIALAIIGVMYIYDQAIAREAPLQPANISCGPPPAVMTDAGTFKPRS